MTDEMKLAGTAAYCAVTAGGPSLNMFPAVYRAMRAKDPHAKRMRQALEGMVKEFEKFSQYGSPIAMEANEAIQFAKAVLEEPEE